MCKTLTIRKTPFLLRAGHVTSKNRKGSIHSVSYIVTMQFLFKWSTKYIPRSIWYTFVFGHLPLALRFSQVFIFRSHRDNFIKFLKIITVSLFLVNNSRQFCTKYLCSQKRTCPVKSPEGDTKLKKSHYYNMLHISWLCFLTSRMLVINLTPIKFFSKENTWLLVVSREKHI